MSDFDDLGDIADANDPRSDAFSHITDRQRRARKENILKLNKHKRIKSSASRDSGRADLLLRKF